MADKNEKFSLFNQIDRISQMQIMVKPGGFSFTRPDKKQYTISKIDCVIFGCE